MRNLITILLTIGMLYTAQAQRSIGNKAPEGFYKLDTGVFVNSARAEMSLVAFDKQLNTKNVVSQSKAGFKYVEGTHNQVEFIGSTMHFGLFETSDARNKYALITAVWTGERTLVAITQAATVAEVLKLSEKTGWLIGFNWVDL